MAADRVAIPLLDLQAQYADIRAEIRSALDRVIDSQHFVLGPEVEILENDIARYSQCRFAIGVSSGTDALLASLMAIGVKPGDEVITTPYTFFATAGCVARAGAKAVFVDIDPFTFNIAARQVEKAVTRKTKAIIPVHLFGQMAEMDPIIDIAQRRNVYVIEDAAQAIGAEYKGRRAGSIGHLGCLSFFPSKNLGGFGDGGMVTTNDPQLAERVRSLRGHGASPKYHHKWIGGNFRLDEIQAAVLRVKLPYLDRWTAARQQNAAVYRRLFAEVYPEGDGIVLPRDPEHGRHIYNQFVIRVGTEKRDSLISHLREKEISSEVYYPVPLHLQECFSELGYRSGDFPESERAAAETLALPIYPELTESMQRVVVQSISQFLRGNG